jgi:uncharacterized membrane protein YhaH (DUF805 family)
MFFLKLCDLIGVQLPLDKAAREWLHMGSLAPGCIGFLLCIIALAMLPSAWKVQKELDKIEVGNYLVRWLYPLERWTRQILEELGQRRSDFYWGCIIIAVMLAMLFVFFFIVAPPQSDIRANGIGILATLVPLMAIIMIFLAMNIRRYKSRNLNQAEINIFISTEVLVVHEDVYCFRLDDQLLEVAILQGDPLVLMFSIRAGKRRKNITIPIPPGEEQKAKEVMAILAQEHSRKKLT